MKVRGKKSQLMREFKSQLSHSPEIISDKMHVADAGTSILI